ncbi:MAG TPA: hypothetical protein VGV64_07775 [Thermoplasmata archaeon]|nr:hypothetical protein [Thermoplasmata archaeon]HEV2429721.1 hypothetical protein [Thermoplasmata archaeon]
MPIHRAQLLNDRLSGPITLTAAASRRPISRVVSVLRREIGRFELHLVLRPRRPRRVSRGLISTAARPVLHPPRSDEAARRAVETLATSPVGGFAWKEKTQWARRLSQWKPDWNGRRISSEACQLDCRYVARIARAAWSGGRLPTDRQWGILRASLQRIYAELQQEA